MAKQDSKHNAILSLLARPKGVTITDISEATQWKVNSVRGYLSNLRKKNIEVTSVKNDNGERIYQAKLKSDEESEVTVKTKTTPKIKTTETKKA